MNKDQNEYKKEIEYIELPSACRPYIAEVIRTKTIYRDFGFYVVLDCFGFSGYVYRADGEHNVFLINIDTGQVVLQDYNLHQSKK